MNKFSFPPLIALLLFSTGLLWTSLVFASPVSPGNNLTQAFARGSAHNILQAFVLSGTVSDTEGNPLPFANVFVSQSSQGVASNEEGFYSLKLPAGNYTLICRYVGFRLQEKEIQLSSDYRVDFVLEPENLLLDSLVISTGEDPAMEIMRKAIAKREDHLRETPAYTVDVYVKGVQRINSAPDKIFGISLNGMDVLDSNNSGIVYLSESESNLSFLYPDKRKEVMYSSRVSGDDQGFSYNEAGAMDISLYNNKLEIEGLSERAFISPMASNAFFFYRYSLDGSFYENGHLINKIKLVPRRKADPVFRGHIYIVEDRWNLHSTDVMLTKAAGIEFVDSLRFKMTYGEQADSSWLPLSREFSFRFGLLGIRGEGYFMGFYRNYDTSPTFPKNHFGPEIMRIEEGSNERDSSYWANIRPIPLTSVEQGDYKAKDSLALLRKQPAYTDSLDRLQNQFSPLALLTGYSWRKTSRKITFGLAPPAALIGYNTVEGWKIGLAGRISKEAKDRNGQFNKLHVLRVDSRYGLTNKRFNAHLSWRYDYKQVNFAYLRLAGGSSVRQFNQGGISELVNTAYSLLAKQNYLKLYEARFASAEWQYEISNGLFFRANLTWEDRIPLANRSSICWCKETEREFTSNVPLQPEAPNTMAGFQRHQMYGTNLNISWRPGQKYMVEPGRKYIIESKWPNFVLSYTTALPLGNKSGVKANPSFGKLTFLVKDKFTFGLVGSANWQARVGGFLYAENLSLIDWQHFPANQTIVAPPNPFAFQLLEYYSHSTADWFTDLHYEHHFNGFIFNKIPGVRKLKFQAVTAFRTLYTPEGGAHWETSFGIEHILKGGRVDFVLGKDESQALRKGILIGVGF